MSQSFNKCRVCGSPLESILDLGDLYVSTFVPERDDQLPKSPLHLKMCIQCGLAQLSHSVERDVLYRQYWYQSSVNQTMKDELQEVVMDALNHYPERSGTWLDIGANDGQLLESVPRVWRRIGCEPAVNLHDSLSRHCDKLVPTYFSADAVAEPVDLVTSCAMFYDLDDPVKFCQDIAKILKPGGMWLNQLSYTPDMLFKNAFDNICHEHVCYYTLSTIQKVYALAKLRVIDFSFSPINGGSIRVTACHRVSNYDIPVRCHTFRETVTSDDYHEFARRVKKWRVEMAGFLGKIWGAKIHVYGASTKGNTLLQYLGMSSCFECAADRNPAKDGLKMVGSWIPIVSEYESRAREPDYYFVLPWGFETEFREREKKFLQGGGRLVFPLPDIRIVV